MESSSKISESTARGLESLPFLEEEASYDASNYSSTKTPKHSPQPWKRICFYKNAILHAIAFISYTCLFIILMAQRARCPSLYDLGLYSPIEDHLEYEARPVDGHAEGSIYAGPPRPESEVAWKALMEGSNVKFYPEEMPKLKENSLEMTDGSGSLVVLGVYHELHCIKRLRKWFYKEYYYPNQTDLEFQERFTHAEHCLELVRQTAICHGDVTPTLFKWLHNSEGRAIEPTTKEGALHKCVKWDSISKWAISRRIDLFEPDVLSKSNA
ncbi:hypothetical protein F5Y11DRAFT_347130 [Daldinia sp. FL1419]|nr:hypothetical protein F5Y11DRAFT_347130 [Daldinia sp. FL1419]